MIKHGSILLSLILLSNIFINLGSVGVTGNVIFTYLTYPIKFIIIIYSILSFNKRLIFSKVFLIYLIYELIVVFSGLYSNTDYYQIKNTLLFHIPFIFSIILGLNYKVINDKALIQFTKFSVFIFIILFL